MSAVERPTDEPDSGVLLASKRDASWHRRPGTAWSWHVVVDGFAACSQPRPGRWPGMALDDVITRPATEVPHDVRCRRPGCRHQWPGTTTVTTTEESR